MLRLPRLYRKAWHFWNVANCTTGPASHPGMLTEPLFTWLCNLFFMDVVTGEGLELALQNTAPSEICILRLHLLTVSSQSILQVFNKNNQFKRLSWKHVCFLMKITKFHFYHEKELTQPFSHGRSQDGHVVTSAITWSHGVCSICY